jgi:glycolate oxidase
VSDGFRHNVCDIRRLRMALSRDAYRELEDIVGPENLSVELPEVEAYTAFGFGATGPEPESRFFTRPEAVVLPGSTAEVQKIIRWCNRRGMKSKASSTGYGGFNAISSEGELFLDMRRMNRILELDEKNMYIVVEPYVCFAQIQAEAQKRGLNVHVIGAGSNCSALASHTSVHGTNTQAVSHSWSGRNVLGVEWVLPTGDILKLGALGSGIGWFSGDGPGPSLRGIMRGAAGALGGLGVFTKCAIHLHPWYGPAEMKLTGVSPDYETEVPPLFEYHMIEWPSWAKCADAQYKIGEAGIAFAFHKTGGPGSCGPIVTGSNNEYYEKWDELKGLPWVSYAIVTAAHSPEEHEYQVKTLDKILEETEGKIMPLGETPFWKDRDYINMVKGCFIPRLAFRVAGAFACPLSGQESIDHVTRGLSVDDGFRKKYDEQGILFNDGNNGMWGVMFDNGHFALFECGHMYSPTSAESWKGGWVMMQEGHEIGIKTPFSSGWGLMTNDRVRELGPRFGNVQNWQVKIKQAFDPNGASDPKSYISVEEKEFGSTGIM